MLLANNRIHWKTSIMLSIDEFPFLRIMLLFNRRAQLSTVPYPLLGENTFVVSDTACVCSVDGVLTLMWRVGDTYANQMVEAHARAYVLRCVPRALLLTTPAVDPLTTHAVNHTPC